MNNCSVQCFPNDKVQYYDYYEPFQKVEKQCRQSVFCGKVLGGADFCQIFTKPGKTFEAWAEAKHVHAWLKLLEQVSRHTYWQYYWHGFPETILIRVFIIWARFSSSFLTSSSFSSFGRAPPFPPPHINVLICLCSTPLHRPDQKSLLCSRLKIIWSPSMRVTKLFNEGPSSSYQPYGQVELLPIILKILITPLMLLLTLLLHLHPHHLLIRQDRRPGGADGAAGDLIIYDHCSSSNHGTSHRNHRHHRHHLVKEIKESDTLSFWHRMISPVFIGLCQ